jgi:hypothetical protein
MGARLIRTMTLFRAAKVRMDEAGGLAKLGLSMPDLPAGFRRDFEELLEA